MDTQGQGLDHQRNLFSATPTGCGVGIGGPLPIPLPPMAFPPDLIFDPSNPRAVLQLGGNPTELAKYDAMLKLGDGFGPWTVAGVSIAQGHEDSLNLNNGVHDVEISGDFAADGSSGLRVITIKGGCRNIRIRGTIHTRGWPVLVQIGAWSDQNYGVSENIDLSGLSWAGGTITVEAIRCRGLILPAGASLDWATSAWDSLYWWAKRAVRAVLRIPKGTAGPGFLS